jgi:hypothetical protein
MGDFNYVSVARLLACSASRPTLHQHSFRSWGSARVVSLCISALVTRLLYGPCQAQEGLQSVQGKVLHVTVRIYTVLVNHGYYSDTTKRATEC